MVSTITVRNYGTHLAIAYDSRYKALLPYYKGDMNLKSPP